MRCPGPHGFLSTMFQISGRSTDITSMSSGSGKDKHLAHSPRSLRWHLLADPFNLLFLPSSPSKPRVSTGIFLPAGQCSVAAEHGRHGLEPGFEAIIRRGIADSEMGIPLAKDLSGDRDDIVFQQRVRKRRGRTVQ